MDEVVHTTQGWTVSIRSRGEVLSAHVAGGGAEVAFLGRLEGFSPAEIEGWLRELIGVADETARPAGPSGDPVPGFPRLLHNVLTGLLFYQAELWSGGAEPCTVAVVDDGESAAFGWVGAGETRMTIDGVPFEPAWIRIRDDEGRAARAFVVERDREIEARIVWATPAAAGTDAHVCLTWGVTRDASVVAHGTPVAHAMPAAVELPQETTSSPIADPTEVAHERFRAGDADAPSPAEPAWRLPAWADGPARVRDDAVDADASREAAAEDEGDARGFAPPTPEPEAPHETPAHTTDPEPPRESEASAFESVMSSASDADAEDVHDVPGVPDWIPPTPEPAALRARSAPLDWEAPPFETSFETGDDLPEPHAAAASEAPRAESTIARAVATRSADVASPPLEVVPLEEAAMPPMPLTVAPPVPAGARRRPARSPDWPVATEAEPRSALVRRAWPWALAVLVLFAIGWMVGGLDAGRPNRRGPFAAILQRVGLGPVRFEVAVTSRPEGAAIAVDGVDAAKLTPALLELPPGAHQVTLSFPSLGSASYNIRGERGERVPLEAALWGSLIVAAPDVGPPVSVTVDEIPRGTAPLTVDSLGPGVHQIRFTGPGLHPWERAVEVRVNQSAEVVAQGTRSPATGFIEVRATVADEGGTQPLTGAMVWVDGQPRGATPLRLELPQGPHSLRVGYRGEEAPVQVLDLPGGNQRFATFELGLASQRPRLVQTSPVVRIALDRPTVMSAALQGVQRADVREMWLHVRTPEGSWRRYPMNTLDSPDGTVGVSVFPTTSFDAQGKTSYYLSAVSQTGDDFFTEIQPAQAVTAGAAGPR